MGPCFHTSALMAFTRKFITSFPSTSKCQGTCCKAQTRSRAYGASEFFKERSKFFALQVKAALQSQASWGRVPGDSLKAASPNAILNAFIPAPLQITWIGNGSDFLVLTDDNQQ